MGKLQLLSIKKRIKNKFWLYYFAMDKSHRINLPTVTVDFKFEIAIPFIFITIL